MLSLHYVEPNVFNIIRFFFNSSFHLNIRFIHKILNDNWKAIFFLKNFLDEHSFVKKIKICFFSREKRI